MKLRNGENPYDNSFPVDIDTNKLWKVNISFEEPNEKLDLVDTKINVNIKEDLGGEELPPLSKTSKHFPSQPADEHIHIIVQRPVEAKEPQRMGRWRKLCEFFTFPDGTENEHIVISRAGLKRKFSTGKMRRKLDQVSSSSQSATAESNTWLWIRMKVLFGLKADSYDQLPCIEIGSSATPEQIRNSVIEDF
ncbi:hypothetical protein GLOIN_2v1571020 [Rhizophagus clarus]|uniref:Crinkler effector protein N-terminal domain-containing protein n=1 Tax=Rhizophagus clarus TaxID=94130 RepID=A0A8H3QIA3_9GLOM|nr:hypothetical protein GLOIN_2v1571020 [Rhizophagus clarus]